MLFLKFSIVSWDPSQQNTIYTLPITLISRFWMLFRMTPNRPIVSCRQSHQVAFWSRIDRNDTTTSSWNLKPFNLGKFKFRWKGFRWKWWTWKEFRTFFRAHTPIRTEKLSKLLSQKSTFCKKFFDSKLLNQTLENVCYNKQSERLYRIPAENSLLEEACWNQKFGCRKLLNALLKREHTFQRCLMQLPTGRCSRHFLKGEQFGSIWKEPFLIELSIEKVLSKKFYRKCYRELHREFY